MEALTYHIGLDDRPLSSDQLSLAISLLSSPTSLLERFQIATEGLFLEPQSAEKLFYILGKDILFQHLDDLNDFGRRQRELLQQFQKSLSTGFRIGITAFHLIRVLNQDYEPPLPANVPPQTAPLSFSEQFTTTSIPFEVTTQAARLSLISSHQYQEAERVGLVKGSHIAAYLLALRHQQLFYQFETSDLDPELEAISQLDANPQTSSVPI